MATDKRMGLVPGIDPFAGLDGDNFAEGAGVKDFLYLAVKAAKRRTKHTITRRPTCRASRSVSSTWSNRVAIGFSSKTS